MKTPVIASLILILFFARSDAQTRLPVDSLINMALRNNPGLQSASLQVEQQRKLGKTAFGLENTVVFYENEDLLKSEPNDNGLLKIGITQGIQFPTVYAAQSKVNHQQLAISQTNYTLTEREMRQQVRVAYFRLLYALDVEKLLRRQDSIFTDFENAAGLRYQTGETNYLEKISADAKHKEIQLALSQAMADVNIAQRLLMNLVKTDQPVLPLDASLAKLPIMLPDMQAQINTHPYLKSFEEQISLSKYQKQLASNMLLPDFSIRYFNQNWYNREPGYYGYSLGVGLPLFFWGKQGDIQSAKLQEQIAQKNYENNLLLFNTQYQTALQEYQKNLSALSYYETSGNQQAEELLSNANEAFKSGNIDYIEYITLLTQSVSIKNNYLNTLNEYNQSVIQLQFFLQQ